MLRQVAAFLWRHHALIVAVLIVTTEGNPGGC